jgi:uncharacterized membrane protein YgcG
MNRYFFLALFLLVGFGANAQKAVDYDDVYASKEDRYAMAVLNNFERRKEARNLAEREGTNGYSPRYDYYRSNDAASRLFRNNFGAPCWGPTWSTCGSGWRASLFMGNSFGMMSPWGFNSWNMPGGGFYNPYADPFFNPYDPFYNPYYASSFGGFGGWGGYYNPWTPVGYNPWLFSNRGVNQNNAWRNANVIRYPYGEIPNDRRSEYYQTRTRENRDYRGTDNRSRYPGSSGNSGWSEPTYRDRDSGGGGRSGGGSVNPGGSGGSRTRRGG